MSELKDALINISEEVRTKVIPENIKAGVQIFDTEGEYTGLDTSDATATAGDIAKDKTAYVNGEKITGTKEISEGGDSEILDSYIATIDTISSRTVTKIPDGVTKIRDYAFYYCTNAKMETLPESVTKIGKWAFGYCQCGDFKTLTLEGDITTIGESAFFYSGYEKIIMKNVTSVPSTHSYKNVFQYAQNKYSTIYVPDNLVADFKRVEPYYSIQTNIKGLSELES